jgi:four helix bundle protein
MARFLQMAMRSASEADYQLLLARDLGYVSDDAYEPIEKEVAVTKRVLNALIRKARSDARRQPRANGQVPIA